VRVLFGGVKRVYDVFETVVNTWAC